MEKVKEYIQTLPLLEQIALSAWLGQLIQTEAEAQVAAGEFLLNAKSPDSPPAWMWNEAEKALEEFENSEESGLSWEEVKQLGDQRKSA